MMIEFLVDILTPEHGLIVAGYCNDFPHEIAIDYINRGIAKEVREYYGGRETQ